MSARSTIEWTEVTWNPVTGCNKVSHGCKFCYAERMSKRLQSMGLAKYRDGFAVRTHDQLVRVPLTWRKPRLVFVNSMSDLFHEAVPDRFILDVFATMNQARQHTFQVLTKRPERVVRLNNRLPWNGNIWMGTSIESERWMDRADHLKKTSAGTRFLSLEPLLGSLSELPFSGIHWVIAGGESGPGARPMAGTWVREIRDKCVQAGVPFFFKQWGGVNKKKAGRLLDDRTWDEFPAVHTGRISRDAAALPNRSHVHRG